MDRRNARLRREYIFRKSLQPKYRAEYKAKKKLRNSLNCMFISFIICLKYKNEKIDGEKVPLSIQDKFDELSSNIKHDDIITQDIGKKSKFLDDEYSMAGIKDPRLLITTSRSPTNKLMRFVKEMKLCFPHSVRVNRGNINCKELVSIARTTGYLFVFCFVFCLHFE